MAQEFSYQARRRSGEVVTGTKEASNKGEVARELRSNNLFIIAIEEEKSKKESIFTRDIDFGNIGLFSKGYSISELANFSQQLSVLIASGIPLVRSLNIVREQSTEDHEKEMLTEVINGVEAGETLSAVLKRFPDYFPKLFVHLIKAGETGGVLDDVLDELVEYYRKRDKINQEVRSALYYPVVIVIVAIIAVFILMGFVLPNILEMLVGFGGDIPLPTQILIGVSGIISGYWWAILFVLILLGVLIRGYIKTPKGKLKKDTWILKIPVVGDLIMKVTVARFASTLALLLKSGVSIMNALPVIEEVVDNEVYADILLETRSRVREGSTLTEPMEKSERFPPMVLQMIKVGEESGNIEEMLNRISDYYDIEVENAIEGGISLIEPLMIIIMAVMVGGIVASIILPLFEVYSGI